MPYIFISYSRKDKAIADYIAAQLRNRGADVFIDYQKLVAGENFIGRIGGEIARCDYFLLLLSPRSVVSRWVQAEVTWAFNCRKTIVPVLLEPASMVDFFVLANLEQIDFTEWTLGDNMDDELAKLATALGLPATPIYDEPVPQLVTGREPEIEDDPEPDDTHTSPITFTREDLSDLFFMAVEVADDDPEQAIFFYRQIVEIEPGYMRGQARAFIAREEDRLKSIRLARMLGQARTKMDVGQWRAAEQTAQDMQALDADNADAQQVLDVCHACLPYEPVYQQAERAAQQERWRAVRRLLYDVVEHCPDYGDPAGLYPRMIPHEPLQLPMLEWCDVPEGEVTINGQVYQVKAFQIAKYPVTNAQYQIFVEHLLGYRDPRWWDYSRQAQKWRAERSKPIESKFPGPKRPRTDVTWYETLAFCRWLSGVTGLNITLPTEVQWQRAAQGDDERIYPWGNEFDAQLCNTQEGEIGQTSDVDRYPAGASPFGVMDMSGNTWEWCLNQYDHPQNAALFGSGMRVARGGAWRVGHNYARCTFSAGDNPTSRSGSDGFRIVCTGNAEL